MVRERDGEGEYDDELEDEEAYEQFVSAFDRYEGAGAGSGAVWPVWEVCMDDTKPGEFVKNLKGKGESIFCKF